MTVILFSMPPDSSYSTISTNPASADVHYSDHIILIILEDKSAGGDILLSNNLPKIIDSPKDSQKNYLVIVTAKNKLSDVN